MCSLFSFYFSQLVFFILCCLAAETYQKPINTYFFIFFKGYANESKSHFLFSSIPLYLSYLFIMFFLSRQQRLFPSLNITYKPLLQNSEGFRRILTLRKTPGTTESRPMAFFAASARLAFVSSMTRLGQGEADAR